MESYRLLNNIGSHASATACNAILVTVQEEKAAYQTPFIYINMKVNIKIVCKRFKKKPFLNELDRYRNIQFSRLEINLRSRHFL